MKRKEIFISYKRVDKDVVFKLKDRIENEVKKDSCWIDLDGIESHAQFVEVIMGAIDEADIVLFMYSAAHTNIKDYSRDWTVREINYAQENGKRIVFVNIDNTPLSKWFTMMFPLKQVVDGTSEPAIEKLIRDIKVWLEETKGEKEMNSYANSFSSEIADDDYETAEVLYKEKEYTDAIPLFLSSAEHGNVNSQNKLCQILYDKVVPMEIIPNEYWDRIEKLATNDEDYANFLMHCKYYDDSANTNLSFEYVKRATKNAKVPLAFLRLGVSYGWGVGIKQNEILANHNYQKAIGLGCKEACSYIGQLYEYGSKKIEKDLSKALEYYKRGAELHDKRSMCKLANYYQYTLRQPDDAKTVAQKMIDYGYYQGYVLMGDYCTYDSNRSWADTEEGKKWYRKALLFDEYEAYAQLAYIYWDVDQNYEEAYALAKQGAAKHNPPSIKALGIFYKIDNELEKSWNCYKEVFYRTGTASGMLGSLFFDSKYRKEDENDEKQLETELESVLKIEAYNGNDDSLKYLLRLYMLQDTGDDTFEFSKLKATPRTHEYVKVGYELGYPEMMYYWGMLLLDDTFSEYNPVKGLNAILKSALEGHNEALGYLFEYYQTGRYKDSVDYDKIAVLGIKNKFVDKQHIESLIRYGENHTEIGDDFHNFLTYILDKDDDAISKKHYFQALNAFFSRLQDNQLIPNSSQINQYRLVVEQERKKENYGYLGKLRKVLDKVYPDYEKDKAIADILDGKKTEDAEIYYATCTTDNEHEIEIERQDSFLCQLYSPILKDTELYQRIIDLDDVELLGQEEKELVQCLVNLTASYTNICKKFEITPCELLTVNDIDFFPYVSPLTMTTLRKQALRCLLSVKDVDMKIGNDFLDCLDNDEKLLNVCEEIVDQDLQLFLISFVELNLDIESLEFSYYVLLENYNENKQVLAGTLNSVVKRITDAGIKHQLPEYTVDNLPVIDVHSSEDLQDDQDEINVDGMETGNTDSEVENQETPTTEKPLPNEVGVKGSYSIRQNTKGEIMLMMNAREGNQDGPRFIYDGGGTALLYRSPESSVVFRNIDEAAREPLKKINEILIVELLNDDVEREYMAPVRLVKSVESFIL